MERQLKMNSREFRNSKKAPPYIYIIHILQNTMYLERVYYSPFGDEREKSNDCRYKSQYKLVEVLGGIVYTMALFIELSERASE